MARSAALTLVELITALTALALVAALGWRGLDALTRPVARAQAHVDEMLALQVGLAQWTAGLDALASVPQASALSWDGRALRLVRRTAGGPAGSCSTFATAAGRTC